EAVRCALEKLPADRFGSTKEFAAALRGGPLPHRAEPTRVAKAERRTAAFLVPGLATIAVAATLAAVWGWLRDRSEPRPTSRFVVSLPKDVVVDNVFLPVTITHDGRTVIFRGIGSTTQLFRRSLDELAVKPIAGTA